MITCSIVMILSLTITMGGKPNLGSSKYEQPLSHWKVGISNEIVGPNQTLVLHCKSKDDDLGEHYLKVGDGFEWKFKENLFSTTLYWCSFRTIPLNFHAEFEVFWQEKGNWLASRCSYRFCFWIARADGVYLQNISGGTMDLVHTWEH